jgi:predicted nucleic acid-binding Zn ribbon protein
MVTYLVTEDGSIIYYQTYQDQMNDVMAIGMSLLAVTFFFGLLRSVVSAVMEPEREPRRLLPQTRLPRHGEHREKRTVTITCPVCGKVVEIPEYDRMTRTEALRRHLASECRGRGGKTLTALPQVTIEGGERVPAQYRYLTGWIDEPLPEYSLLTELLPAVEPEVKERKIDAVLRQLKDGVESIQQSENFRLFPTTMSKFHEYSIGNQILIMLQKPDATKVAGFNTWKELGRWVKKGEKGIAILAPVLPPRPSCPACGAKIPRGARYCPQCGEPVEAEEEIEVTPRYFKVVYVFDLSQTEGKPLPEFEVPVLTGGVNEELFSKLLELMRKRGVPVSFESRPQLPPEVKGEYTPAGIWVRPEERRAQQLKTLLHEVAHYYSQGVFRIPRRDAETIAESAAFVVGAHYGFDTGVRSFPYVALWAQDKKVLEQNLEAIRRVATAILEGLEA